jgi:predicted DCC family thiol-disulfide oxidoreductase YuxK
MNADVSKVHTTIVFDTDCVLCSSWVHFILRHERDKEIRFVSAWSDEGGALAAGYGLQSKDLNSTYLVVEGHRGFVRSDAGLALLKHLSMPWRSLRILALVPRPFRDAIYTLVASNRYRWFGHSPSCFVPPLGQAHRFINGSRSNPHSPSQRQAATRP